MLELAKSGRAFVSQAIIEGNFALRACIAKFRTSANDIKTLPALIKELWAKLDGK